VPLALTGYETGLLVVALVFVCFALVMALVVPRSRPDFPGKRLGVFIAACVVLFLAQMTAVFLLAEVGEADEPAVEGTDTTPTETTPTETTPTETTPTETTPTETTGAEGDPVAGKEIFVAKCGTCHTLADAGTTGEMGPDLDALAPPYETVVTQVTNGGGGMPAFQGDLSEQQIQDVAAYVSSATG
jgi:mono/diheme cytochrome c family protein